MICSKCGAEIQDGNNFCPKCGQGINVHAYKFNDVDYQKEDIIKIAKYQTMILYGLLLCVIFTLMKLVPCFISSPDIIGTLTDVLQVFSALFCLIVFCLLRSAEKGNIVLTILGAILLFITGINLIVLFFANNKATKILKSAGLKVGLMGVSKFDLDEFKNKR